MYGVSALSVILLAWVIFMEIRLRKVFGGRGARDLEDVMRGLISEIEEMHKSRADIEKYLETVEKRLLHSIQYVGVVRFNPFHDAGGDQSFALAIMDEKKNGFVISSLYGRETSRMYGKPLLKGTSTYQLSKEEEAAIEAAIGSK